MITLGTLGSTELETRKLENKDGQFILGRMDKCLNKYHHYGSGTELRQLSA